MSTVTVFGDVACPFTYAGLLMLREERERRGVALPLRLRAWPLERINGRPLDPNHVAREIDALRPMLPDRFGGFSTTAFPRTSVPAFGVTEAGYRASNELGEQAAFALREAIFEQGLDVGDPEVVRHLATDLGAGVLNAAESDAAVQNDQDLGRELGVVGSPHFVTAAGNWFCPLLSISETDGVFDVTVDEGGRSEFFAALFDRDR